MPGPRDLDPEERWVRMRFVREHVRPLLAAAREFGIPTPEVLVTIIGEQSRDDDDRAPPDR